MSSPSTTRDYYENGSGRIAYNAYNNEDYNTPKEIPPPKYIGGLGDGCNNKSQCHELLYCYKKNELPSSIGVCSNWSPMAIPYSDPRNRDGNQIVQNKEGFVTKSAPKQRELKYTSKTLENSGRNYYAYDDTY